MNPTTASSSVPAVCFASSSSSSFLSSSIVQVGAGLAWLLLAVGLAACSGASSEGTLPAGAAGGPGGGTEPVAGTPVGGGFELAPADGPQRLVTGTELRVPVRVKRAGVSGAIKVTAAALPEGVSAAPLTLGSGEDAGEITLTAVASVKHGAYDVRLEGVAEGSRASAPLALVVRGKPGELDTSFGTGGRAVIGYLGTPAPSVTGRLRVKETSIYVAGACGASTCAHRLGPDGGLDGTYGSTLPLANPTVAEIDGAGRLVVGGGGAESPLVGRFDAAGKPDASFGAGVIAIAPGLSFPVKGLAIGPASEVLAAWENAGWIQVHGRDASGQPLPGFGWQGTTAINFGTPATLAGIRFRPSSTTFLPAVLVFGMFGGGSSVGGVGVAHARNEFVDDGGLTPTKTTWLGQALSANGAGAVALSGDRAVVVGTAPNGGQVFVRSLWTNEIDPSFGDRGTAQAAVSGSCRALAADSADNLLCALGPNDRLVRLTAAGALDAGFGVGGYATFSADPTATALDVQVQADGRILLLASSIAGGSAKMSVARIWN